jgi:hypothetical protein
LRLCFSANASNVRRHNPNPRTNSSRIMGDIKAI